jgi:Flp pilus assembly protein TadG
MSRQIPKKTTHAIQQAIRMFTVGEDGASGAAIVEFTIFAPLLVVASIYTTDFGLYYFNQMEVQNAAQTGAEYAILNAAPPSSINGITISPPSMTYYCQSTPVENSTCSDGSIAEKYITVLSQATYNTLSRFGFFSNATYTLNGFATVRVQ